MSTTRRAQSSSSDGSTAAGAAVAGTSDKNNNSRSADAEKRFDGKDATDGAKHKDGTPGGAKGILRKVEAMLPDYYTAAFRDPRAWKTFFRCMVATFATLVLLLCQTTLNKIGSATFFALIMSQMLAPNMAISVFFFAFIMVLLGICLGWAWGAAAMAASLQGRSQVLFQQQLLRFQTQHANDVNPDAEYQASIFQGYFLDPVASTIYGVFLFVGAYFFGFIRAKKPRLTIACIFAVIILDLMCTFGPLFPFAQYTIAVGPVSHENWSNPSLTRQNNLVIPALVYIAVAVACIILIFPQSLHSIMVDGTVKSSLGPSLSLLSLQDEVLATSPGNHEKWGELTKKAYGLRMAHVAGITGLEGQLGLLQLEITRSRMSAGDLTKVFAKAKALGGRAFGLASFQMITHERHESLEKQRKESPGNHPHPRTKRALDASDRHDEATRNLEQLIPLMREASEELRAAANKALKDGMAWMTEINHARWKKPKGGWSDISVREKNYADLKAALADFRASKHFIMLEPFKEAFDEEGRLRPESGKGAELSGELAHSARDLFRCYVFTTSLAYFCDVELELLELLLDIERRNPKNKVQLPDKFAKKLVESANSSEGGGNPLDTGSKRVGHEDDDSRSEETAVDEEKGVSARGKNRPKDPDARTPHNGFQKIVGLTLHKIWKVLSSSAGVFALKQGLASMAIYAIAVAPQTAGFFYENRGLWALIMAQTGMGVYTGEQIGGFILRFGGTVVGLVVGMVAWYVGAGSGPGNPYGIAASTMVFIAPFLWGRVQAPQAQMVFPLMAGVTMMLVVGYGWVDEHVYQTANQGSGAALAGRRGLLVIIGFAVAFLVMLFPKPDSAKVLVRRTLAKNLSDLGDLYGVMIGAMEDEAEENAKVVLAHGRNTAHAESEVVLDVDARQARYRDRFLGCASRLLALQPSMKFASLEPGLKGPWPKEEYQQLLQYQLQMISSLALLSGATARLEQKWVRALAERVAFMHPAFIADTLTLFALLHQALAHGGPLPATMPIFERLAYHHTRHPVRTPGRSPAAGHSVHESAGSATSDPKERIWEEEQNIMVKMEDQLSWKTVQDEQFAIFATANVALIHIINALNETHRVVLSLVGEKELGGFDRAQERWGQREAEAAAI